jgi:serine phosphatase RsbU (regulator of sigma subunit)
MVAPLIDWGAAARARSGETESGDAFIIKSVPHGVLIGVADGLGYGVEAAEAARKALKSARSHPNESLTEIAQSCHLALRGTRGAALTLVHIDGPTGILTWLGVGTVAGTLWRARVGVSAFESLLLGGGMLGQVAPPVMTASLPISTGDTLVLLTNGVRWRPEGGSIPRAAPAVMARRLLDENAISNDDALVLVARYRG